MFIVWYPIEFRRLHNLQPYYWNSLLESLISSGNNLAYFLQLMPLIILHFSFHPTLLDLQRRHDMKALPNTSTYGRQRDSSTGHPSKCQLGLVLLNFSDLTRTDYHTATCYPVSPLWLLNCWSPPTVALLLCSPNIALPVSLT